MMEYSLSLPTRILRTVQAVFSIIVLSLSAYVANWYNTSKQAANSPSQINFLVFASLFSMLSVGFLVLGPKIVPRMAQPFVMLSIEVINVIFWFAGFIALGVFLNQLLFCRGSVCGAARTDTVFASFLFVTWTATVVLLAKDVSRGGFRRGNRGSGAAAMAGPYPAMKETA